MRPGIIISIIVGTLLTVIIFILAILFVLHMDKIFNFFNETVGEYITNNDRRRRITRIRRQRRQRRNAIYVNPYVIREIELTPLPKKNFKVIENPNSPYTLGIECLSE